MWKMLGIIMFLGILSVWDCRNRKVPLWILMLGGVPAMGFMVQSWNVTVLSLWDIAVAVVPGLLLVAVAVATKKAGMGDGILLMELGIALGYQETILLLTCSLLLMSLFSMVMLMLRKVHRNTKLPYIPFLGITCLAFWLHGGLR